MSENFHEMLNPLCPASQHGSKDFDLELDVMGCQPALFKLYTQLAFVFRTTDATTQSDLVPIISSGLERLTQNFPWVAGQVVDINANIGGAPSYRMRPYKATPSLTVQDYTKDASIPTLAQMESAGFPMSMLSEKTWAPCSTLNLPGFDSLESPGNANFAPIMLVQVSFIQGGTILCINVQHNVCDMMGQAAIMTWLSKACRGEQITAEEIEIGNMPRAGVVQPLSDRSYLTEGALDNQLVPPLPIDGTLQVSKEVPLMTDASSPPVCLWSYFHFNEPSVQALKDLTLASLPSNFSGYVSTDDALSAFIFQSIIRARRGRLQADRPVRFARAVDARRYLGVASTYPGILQNMAYLSSALDSIVSSPLGHVAAVMREQVDPAKSDVAWRTRALVAFMSESTDNISKVNFTASLDMGVDIALSSWMKVNAYSWGFGLGLGTPIAVRRPCFLPVESLIYLMPRDSSGRIAVAICLRKEDLSVLQEDQRWIEFTEYIG